MTIKIHHNTLKKAAAHNIALSFNATNQEFNAFSKEGVLLTHGTDPRDVLDLAVRTLNDGGDPVESTKPAKAPKPKSSRKPKRRKVKSDDGEEGDDEDQGHSVVKDKYKEKYQSHKMTCGDTLVNKLRDYCTVTVLGKVRTDGKRSRTDTISIDKLEKLGRANEVWNPSWRSLRDRHGNVNVGMIRMNLGNRLRAMARRKQEIKWPS